MTQAVIYAPLTSLSISEIEFLVRCQMPVESVHSTFIVPPAALLDHWQGHRRLTRRVIESFPEDQLFSFSIGSMRPFGAMALEMLGIAEPMLRGIVTGEWDQSLTRDARPKQEVLRLWDESTEKINRLWPQIPVAIVHGVAPTQGAIQGECQPVQRTGRKAGHDRKVRKIQGRPHPSKQAVLDQLHAREARRIALMTVGVETAHIEPRA